MNLRKLKRLTSVVLSLSMVFSMNMTAFAMETAPTEPVAEEAVHEHVLAVDESQSTPATCGEEGVEVKVCECGYSETETVAATGEHTQESKLDETTNEVVTSCTECGKELARAPYEDNFDLAAEGETTDPDAPEETPDAECTNHVIGSMVSRVAPTCFTEGTAAHYYCSACNNYYRKKEDATAQTNPVTLAALKISKLNHNATLVDEVEADCTTAGNAAYYTCTICKRIYETMEDVYEDVEDKTSVDSTCLSEEEIAAKITKPALGHSYKAAGTDGVETRTVVFSGWNIFDPTTYEQGTDCGISASRSCSREGCTYSQTAGNVSVEKGDVTGFDCTTENAKLAYTATATFTDDPEEPSETGTPATETDEHDVAIDGHKYTYQFTWPNDPNSVLTNTDGKLTLSADNKVTFSRACNVCEQQDQASDSVDATLSSTGIVIGEYALKCFAEEKTFVATATLGDHTQTESKTLTLPIGNHALTFVERVEATCTSEGNYEYFQCTDCQKKFWDESTPIGDNETTDIPELGHNILPPVYSFEGKTDIVKATFSCMRSEQCGAIVTKTTDVIANMESGTPDNASAVCGTDVTMSYNATAKFDRNVVKYDENKGWYEDTTDPNYDATFVYGNGTVTRSEKMPHTITAAVRWADADSVTPDGEGKEYHNPEAGIKATLSCSRCQGTAEMASQGATADTPSSTPVIALGADAVLALGEIDTSDSEYIAANCSTGGKDVYLVTITGVTGDDAATEFDITDKKIKTDTQKSGHKYIIKTLEEGTFDEANSHPTVSSMTIGCALNEGCPGDVNGDPIAIKYSSTDADPLVTLNYPIVNGTPEAGNVQEVSCTTDGVKVWAVDVTINADNQKAYKEYPANGAGKRWTLSQNATATGHDFTGTPVWDWTEYGTVTGDAIVPFEGTGKKVYATYTCQNGNCGGEQHADSETEADNIVYDKADNQRIKVVSVEPTNNKDNINDCTGGGTVTYTATVAGTTDTNTKTQAVSGHVWNTVTWGDWTYVLDTNNQKTYKTVTIGEAPNQTTVNIPVKTITASRECSICGGKENFAETADAAATPAIKDGITVQDQDTEPASCNRAGSTLYFATLTIPEEGADGADNVIKNKTPDIEVYKATGHNYDILWTWFGLTEENRTEVEVSEANKGQIIRYTSASAVKECQNGDCEKTIESTAAKFTAQCINGQDGVSCDKTDVFKYEATATFKDDPQEGYSAQKMIIHEETGHDYEWGITNWSAQGEIQPGDFSGLNLKGVCKNNERHEVILENVTVTVAANGITQTPETCSAKASLVVSGAFLATKNGENYSGTATYRMATGEGDPTGPHKYTVAKPVWTTLEEVSRDEQNVTYEMDAVVTCDHAAEDANHNKAGVKITAVASLEDVAKIDCSKEYDITYTLSINGQAGTDADASLAGIVIEDETLQEDGVTAIVSHTATNHTLSRVDGKAGSCNESGWKAYYHCSVCERNYSSFTGTTEVTVETIAPLGHLYGDPTFEWVKEGESARAIFTCMRPGCTTATAGHTKAVSAEVDTDEDHIYPEGEDGCVDSEKHKTNYYMVSVRENGKTYEGDLAVAVPSVDHNFTGEDGTCIYCGKKGLVKASFVYKNGAETVTISDEWYNKEDTDITLPAAPNRPGYTFKAWSLDGTAEATKAQIIQKVQAGQAFTVTALYTEITTTGTVTVKYLNGSNELNYTKPDNGDVYTGTIGKNIAVSVEETLTIGEKTYTFSHWVKTVNGATLGTSVNYDVYIASDAPITVYAVYQEGSAEKPEAVPVVAMTDIYKFTAPDGTNKLAFTSAMSIPEGYEMVESGILYGIDAATFEGKDTEELNSILTLNGEKVFKSALNGTKTNLLSVKISSANEQKEIYARGYLMCRKAGTDTVEVYYSDSVHENYKSASPLATAQAAN